MRRERDRLLLIVSLLASFARAQEPAQRYQPVFLADYQGEHPELAARYGPQVEPLLKKLPSQVAVRLGLSAYEQGFRYPITIRFVDHLAPHVAHALAGVTLDVSGGRIRQEFEVSLDDLAKDPMDFELLLAHEMTHAVLTDSTGALPSLRFEPWLQEGLAEWASGDGEMRLRRARETANESPAADWVRDIDAPETGKSYVQYYLAIKYLIELNGTPGLQAFVRLLVQGVPPKEALRRRYGLGWTDFKSNVKAYTIATLSRKTD